MNLAHVIDGHDGTQVALIDGDDRITYDEVRDRVGRLRTQFTDLGIGTGDAVAMAVGNEPHFATTVLALLGLGAIPMPLNPHSTRSELAEKIEVGRPRFLVAGQEGRRALGHAGQLAVDVVDLEVLAGEASAVAPDHTVVERDPTDTAFYMATSGVSGVPKVAVLSHGNLDWVQQVLLSGDDPVTPSDVFLGVLPFAHVFGLNVVLLTSLRVGSCIALQRTFDAVDGLRIVREHSVTILGGAPPMWRRWADAASDDNAFATVRLASSGAAALPFGVFDTVRQRFGLEIAQGYGLTETAPVVTMGRGFPIRPSSVGKVVEGATVALVDASGHPVDVGDEGDRRSQPRRVPGLPR